MGRKAEAEVSEMIERKRRNERRQRGAAMAPKSRD